MRRTISTLGALIVGSVLVCTAEREARACGGCFSPPESDSVVTDHRMILSVSPQQTTLYDQIRYSGNPSSFAWVLPINGTATVGLSADVVFGVLDTITQSQVVAPPPNCPLPPDSCRAYANAGASAPEDAAGAGGGVTVTKTEVVGPYETVQLHATDPQALNNWLASHSYSIPPDVVPIIDAYVAEKFDFLAMKLQPGQSVKSMRPVRVTTSGASPILPLRMVTAGTGATVGITLWVIGDGAYETDNFPSFHIGDDELVWNWQTSSSNFKELRTQKEAALNGRGWEIESSIGFPRDQIINYVKYGAPYAGGGGGPVPAPASATDYLPVTDSTSGAVTKTAEQVRDEDMTTLFAGMSATSPRVTRIRSDIAHAALSTDLTLKAAANQTELSNIRRVTRESGQPNCPVYNGCDVVGNQPRDQAAAQTAANNGDHESFSCATAPHSLLDDATLSLGLGFLGFAVIRNRRRRR